MMIDYLRELNLASVFLRLTLAMFFGGMIGIEREKKRRPAGFRTYMLVCLGATLAGIISQYNYVMINTVFADIASEIGRNTDVTRIGAKVIGGVGFLGAGTIIVTDRQEVKGLTTAAGLWASACMGLAIGAGYYECAVLACITIFLTITVLNNVEKLLTSRTKNMNINVTLGAVNQLPGVLDVLRSMNIKIFDVEITNVRDLRVASPSVIIEMKLPRSQPHADIITAVAAIEGVQSVEEP